MLCERCGQAEATEHFSEISEASIQAGELCRRCYLLELGPVPIDEARAWMRALPPQTFDSSAVVLEWSERAQLHGQSLPRDIQIFIERHRFLR